MNSMCKGILLKNKSKLFSFVIKVLDRFIKNVKANEAQSNPPKIDE